MGTTVVEGSSVGPILGEPGDGITRHSLPKVAEWYGRASPEDAARCRRGRPSPQWLGLFERDSLPRDSPDCMVFVLSRGLLEEERRGNPPVVHGLPILGGALLPRAF